MSEVFTIEIHPCIRVVGVLLPQGHDLLWKRKAHLYMVPPHCCPLKVVDSNVRR